MDSDTMIQLLGAFLLGDDAEDIGQIDRLHHWQLGAAMVAFPFLRKVLEKESVVR